MMRVLIADDHPVVRWGLRQILAGEKDIEVAGEAENYGAIMKALRESACDVLVLDITLPGKDGIEVLKIVRAEMPRVKVLMLSNHPEEHFGVRALKAGAAGYLTKDSAPERLVEALRDVVRGRKYVTPALAQALAERVGDSAETPALELLSDREFQILRLIVSGRKPAEIASQLSLSPKTVSVYRGRILAKLRLRTNAELAGYALKHGLLD